jgi:WD40 repeat protein
LVARVFISHASEDVAIALKVRDWLRSAGHEVFLDRDLEVGLRVGDAWRQRLFEEINRADALVCIVTRAFAASPWCAAEVGIAQAYGLRVLPVRAERAVEYRLISSETQWADLTGNAAWARAELVEALHRLDGMGGTSGSDGSRPYPGLRAFDADLARFFFGRKAESDQLAKLLRASARSRRAEVLAVVGPSGCGKSSLVRAGLAQRLSNDPSWLVLPPLMPGVDPVGALAGLLVAAGRQRDLDWHRDRVLAKLEQPGGVLGLAADLLAAAPPAQRLLIVLDQAEELLAVTSQAQRQRFTALLKEATTGPVRVVATLRSEYLDPLSHLAAEMALDISTFLLAPLSREVLPQVVTGPARQAGIAVDDELAARLVADTADGEALPLLAFVLEQLAVDVGRGGKLSMQRYEQLGGVHRALAGRADAALADACAATGRSASDVLAGLLRLVTVDEAGQVTRRRVDHTTLPDQVRTELDQFVARRLLTSDVDNGGNPVVEVTHEHIFTAWRPLAEAIGRATDILRLRTTVEDAADDWHRRGRPADHLWELGRATTAAGCLDSADISPNARAFLETARRHGQSRRRRATVLLAVLLLLVTAGGTTAGVEWRSAVGQRDAAKDAQLRATIEGLLARADTVRPADPRAALRLAMAADEIAGGPRTRSNLLDTLVDTDRLSASISIQGGTVWSADLTADGSTMATSGAGGTVILWDTRNRAAPRRLTTLPAGHGAVLSAEFSADGSMLATGSADGTVTLWDTRNRAAPRRRSILPAGGTTRDCAVWSVAFTTDGSTLATAGSDGTATLWDVTNPAAPIRSGAIGGDPARPVLSLALTADGSTLATGSHNGMVMLWNITHRATPRPLWSLREEHGGDVWSMDFTPDGATLATSSSDGAAILWDTTNPWDTTKPAAARRIGDTRDTRGGHAGPVFSVAFTAKGSILATGSTDGTVILWNVRDPASPLRLGAPLIGHSGTVWSVDFTADGTTLATGSTDGTVILWNVAKPDTRYRLGSPLAGHPGPVFSVAFTADGSRLATASRDGTVHLWDVDGADPASTRSRGVAQVDDRGNVWSVDFAPDGATLATGGGDGTVTLWNVTDPTNPSRVSVLKGHSGPVFSVTFTADGSTLAAGGADGKVLRWDVNVPANPRPLGTLEGHSGPVFSVAFTPDGSTLATGSLEGTVTLWDLTRPSIPRSRSIRLTDQSGNVWSTKFTVNGKTLATGSEDGTVTLWDVTNPGSPHRLSILPEGHTGAVWSVAFTGKGTTLATASLDGTAMLWDVTNPAMPHRIGTLLRGGTGSVYSVAFTEDGSTLATGSGDTTALLWDLSSLDGLRADARKVACQRAGRGLNPTEWQQYIPDLPYRRTC